MCSGWRISTKRPAPMSPLGLDSSDAPMAACRLVAQPPARCQGGWTSLMTSQAPQSPPSPCWSVALVVAQRVARTLRCGDPACRVAASRQQSRRGPESGLESRRALELGLESRHGVESRRDLESRRGLELIRDLESIRGPGPRGPAERGPVTLQTADHILRPRGLAERGLASQQTARHHLRRRRSAEHGLSCLQPRLWE